MGNLQSLEQSENQGGRDFCLFVVFTQPIRSKCNTPLGHSLGSYQTRVNLGLWKYLEGTRRASYHLSNPRNIYPEEKAKINFPMVSNRNSQE